jgi:hypothetical protein
MADNNDLQGSEMSEPMRQLFLSGPTTADLVDKAGAGFAILARELETARKRVAELKAENACRETKARNRYLEARERHTKLRNAVCALVDEIDTAVQYRVDSSFEWIRERLQAALTRKD